MWSNPVCENATKNIYFAYLVLVTYTCWCLFLFLYCQEIKTTYYDEISFWQFDSSYTSCLIWRWRIMCTEFTTWRVWIYVDLKWIDYVKTFIFCRYKKYYKWEDSNFRWFDSSSELHIDIERNIELTRNIDLYLEVMKF